MSFARKAPSKQAQRTALVSLLAMRRTLEGVDAESLSRSYGLPAAEVSQLVEQERRRRAAR
jgi:hypothetical protein